MKLVFHLFLFLGKTCFCQIDFVNSNTTLPNDLKYNTISVKAVKYHGDTIRDEFLLLSANYTPEGKLKLNTFHHEVITEHYYVMKPSERRYIYKKHKEIIKTSSEYRKDRKYRNSKSIKYFKDTVVVKTKYITRGRFKWVRSMHRKNHLEWRREKHVVLYTYDLRSNSVQRNDKDGNRYTSQLNSQKKCTTLTYLNSPFYSDEYKLSWIQSFHYDSSGNMTEMVETNEVGDTNWRVTNEYNEIGLLVCNKLYNKNENGLFFQINFTYEGEILLQREDLDPNDDTKIIYYYSYK